MQVPVHDAELYCSVSGTGADILVLTAIGTQPYELQTRQMNEHFRLVYVDLRGSGRSGGAAEDLSFDVLAADLESICDELQIEKPAVMGHSILGALAIEFGRRRPDRASHVIAVGAPPRGDMAWLAAKQACFFQADASEERKQLLPDNLEELLPDQALLAQTPLRFFDARMDAAPLYAGAEMRPEMMQHLLGKLLGGWNISEDTGSLRVPTLLAHGRFDYIVPHYLWNDVIGKLPNTTFQLFQRSGHQPFVEEPETFCEYVKTWMHGTGK